MASALRNELGWNRDAIKRQLATVNGMVFGQHTTMQNFC